MRLYDVLEYAWVFAVLLQFGTYAGTHLSGNFRLAIGGLSQDSKIAPPLAAFPGITFSRMLTVSRFTFVSDTIDLAE